MTTGFVFDIREFTVHDGPGIRTTVFLKGCPLRCMWCHNPEGLSPEPEVMRFGDGNRTAGVEYTAQDLAKLLNRQAIAFADGGGVTFSGGEPLMQARFVTEVIDRLDGLHVVLDTSGYSDENAFTSVARRVNLVYFDLKLIDDAAHRRYTGVSNGPILRNLRALNGIGADVVARVPLVPGVSDSPSNLEAIAREVEHISRLIRVDLLPYNTLAGAKYAACGRVFAPTYDPKAAVYPCVQAFVDRGIAVTVGSPIPPQRNRLSG